jgi:hypothetical protein
VVLGYTPEHHCGLSQLATGYRSQIGTASTMRTHAPPPGFPDGLSTRSSEPADPLLQ